MSKKSLAVLVGVAALAVGLYGLFLHHTLGEGH